jgi:hypothetical protein
MAIVIKSKCQFLVASRLLVIKIESKQYFFLYYYVEEQARRVLPDCSSHPTICLEVGVEIITWITHLEEKKSNLVATHDLFT